MKKKKSLNEEELKNVNGGMKYEPGDIKLFPERIKALIALMSKVKKEDP